MKNIKSFREYEHRQNVQEGIKDYLLGGLATLGSMAGSPQTAVGQSKTPTDIVTPTSDKKDILGRPLIAPPSERTENLGDYKYLLTKKLINPTPKKDAEMKAKGYKIVWKDTLSSGTLGTSTLDRKSPTIMKSDNDKFFELGGYNLTQEVKERISSQINNLGGVDSVQIEASTDKTRLTPKLKSDLESKGYSGDNKGLSKARSNSIKQFLISLGVNPQNITEINLADQGKEGGYDPSARYVKLVLVEKGEQKPVDGKYSKSSEEFVVYYQKINDTKQKRPRPGKIQRFECEGGVCPTYD